MSGIMRLKGKKVIIRPKNMSDAGNEYAWATDSELMALDASPVLDLNFNEFSDRLKEEIEHPRARHRRFAIQTPEGKHIGNCACYNIDNLKKESELGILIGDQDYLGKGYGTDAVTVLVRYAFNDLGLRRIRLRTLKSNARAQRCFTKCGFTRYGRTSQRGYDFTLMELHRDWVSPANTSCDTDKSIRATL